ncbi:hypothetical protein D3C84_838220 [compost metagenome]
MVPASSLERVTPWLGSMKPIASMVGTQSCALVTMAVTGNSGSGRLAMNSAIFFCLNILKPMTLPNRASAISNMMAIHFFMNRLL